MKVAWVQTTTLFQAPKGKPGEVVSSSNYVDLKSNAMLEDGTKLRRKDVLKVGRYFVGGPDGKGLWWEATSAMLREAANNFVKINADLAAAKAEREFNLVKGHGNPETKQVDHDSIVTPIRNVVFDGQTLHADFGLDDSTVSEYRKPGKGRVSVRFVRQWQCPTTGKTYKNVLVHVALVDQPVYGGQGGWVDLQTAADAMGKGGSMDFQATLDGVNKLLGYWGLTMPTETTEENFDSMFSVMLQQVEGIEGGSGDPAPTDPPAGDPAPPPGGDNNAQLSVQIKNAMDLAISPLVKRLDSMELEKKAGAESSFRQRVTGLIAAGLPAKDAQHALDLGALTNWNQKAIDLAESKLEGAGVDLSNVQSRRFANPNPPKRKGAEPLDPKRVDDAAASMGGTRVPAKK